jgi:hypothetical protein
VCERDRERERESINLYRQTTVDKSLVKGSAAEVRDEGIVFHQGHIREAAHTYEAFPGQEE